MCWVECLQMGSSVLAKQTNDGRGEHWSKICNPRCDSEHIDINLITLADIWN